MIWQRLRERHFPCTEDEPEINSDSVIAKRKTRSARKAAPKKCMADEATDDEGKDGAASDAEPVTAAKSTGEEHHLCCCNHHESKLYAFSWRFYSEPSNSGMWASCRALTWESIKSHQRSHNLVC